MKIQINQDKFLLFLCLLMFFSCSKHKIIDKVSLIEISKINRGENYNLNLYYFENYDNNKSLIENISNIDTLRCLVLISKESNIKGLKEIIKNDSIKYPLKKITITFNDNLNYDNFRSEYRMVSIDTVRKPCYYYFIYDNFKEFKYNHFGKKGASYISL